MVCATDVPCEAHVVALLAQVPRNRARTCPLKHGLVKNPEFIEAPQNAERQLSDTKEKAIRIANDLSADCRDRASRSDLAQLLEPVAAGEPPSGPRVQ